MSDECVSVSDTGVGGGLRRASSYVQSLKSSPVVASYIQSAGAGELFSPAPHGDHQKETHHRDMTPSPFYDKWQGTFYILSLTDKVGHTKALDYPVTQYGGAGGGGGAGEFI